MEAVIAAAITVVQLIFAKKSIMGSTQFITTRYLGRALDRLEKGYAKSLNDKNSSKEISPRS